MHKFPKNQSLPSINRKKQFKKDHHTENSEKNDRKTKKNKLFKLSVPQHRRDLNNLTDLDNIQISTGINGQTPNTNLDFSSAIH